MNFPVTSKSQDFQVIVEFFKSYSVEISSGSVNSFAIFADHVGAKTDLLFSAREILGRHEWKTILNGSKTSQELKEIHSEHLKQWINQRLSSEASQPWINAISEIVGRSSPPLVNYQATSSVLSVENLGPWRFSSIAIITALITAGSLVLLKQCQVQNISKPAQFGEVAVHSPVQSEKIANKNNFPNSGQSSEGSAVDAGATAAQVLRPQLGFEDKFIKTPSGVEGKHFETRGEGEIDSTFKLHSEVESFGRFLNRKGSPGNVARSTNTASNVSLLQLAEEGAINPDRLILSKASSFASHWVQQIIGSPASYLLRLRTNSQLSRSACESMIKDYQSNYQSSGRPLSVVIESSRYRPAGLSQGYLPVCRSAGTNLIEYIKYG